MFVKRWSSKYGIDTSTEEQRKGAKRLRRQGDELLEESVLFRVEKVDE
jgi:hypothetical protein